MNIKILDTLRIVRSELFIDTQDRADAAFETMEKVLDLQSGIGTCVLDGLNLKLEYDSR